MGTLLWLVATILDIFAITDVMRSRRDSATKVALIAIILLIPYAGARLYLFPFRDKSISRNRYGTGAEASRTAIELGKIMRNDKLAQFANKKYLNLESYRRNGQGVRTPLWFVEDDGALYFYTVAHSYKVKRIRNNPRVRV